MLRLKKILAAFIFLVAESESELVERLIDRKNETAEALLVRVATAREEVNEMQSMEYVIRFFSLSRVCILVILDFSVNGNHFFLDFVKHLNVALKDTPRVSYMANTNKICIWT